MLESLPSHWAAGDGEHDTSELSDGVVMLGFLRRKNGGQCGENEKQWEASHPEASDLWNAEIYSRDNDPAGSPRGLRPLAMTPLLPYVPLLLPVAFGDLACGWVPNVRV
jgi:hypothetical protein